MLELAKDMPRYDPHHDAEPTLTVHERLAYVARDRESQPTTQDLQDDVAIGILSFPTETLSYLFRHLANAADLARLCRVCKRFFAIALPVLYGNLNIDIRSEVDTAYLRMLTRENPGLDFVRTVFAHVSKDFCEDSALSQQSARVLINHLPINKLRAFHWCGGHPFPPTLVIDLWQRQRDLHYIEIVPQSHYAQTLHNGADVLQTQLEKLELMNLSSVRAILDTLRSASLTNIALQRGHVTELNIDARSWTAGDAREHKPKDYNPNPDDNSDDGIAPPHGDITTDYDPDFPVFDPLTSNLFSHLPRVRSGLNPPTRTLTRLTLHDVNLTLSKHTWFTYLYLNSLEYLKIKYCKGADMFVLNLANHFPALRSFEVVHYVPYQGDRTLHALDEFLNLQPVNQLHTLKICLRNTNKLPSADAIRKHRRTLEILKIDVARRVIEDIPFAPPGAPHHPVSPAKRQQYTRPWYSTHAFNAIVDSCQYLVELALAFPPFDLHYVDMEPNKDADNYSFNQYIDKITSKLRYLCTLNILNWPHHYKTGKQSAYYLAKNASLARLAADVFRRFRAYDVDEHIFDDGNRHTTLEVIAFGVSERTASGVPKLPKAVYFVPSQTDSLGRKSWSAQTATWEELFDHALERVLLDVHALDFEKGSRKGSPHDPSGVGVDDSDSDF